MSSSPGNDIDNRNCQRQQCGLLARVSVYLLLHLLVWWMGCAKQVARFERLTSTCFILLHVDPAAVLTILNNEYRVNIIISQTLEMETRVILSPHAWYE